MAWLTKIFNFVAGGTFSASPVPLTEGQSGPILVDPLGRVAVTGGAPAIGQRVVQLAPADRGELKAGAGALVEVVVWSVHSTNLWLQIFDAAAAPANGATPLDQIMVPPGASLSWRPVGDLRCATGIQWAASIGSGSLTYVDDSVMGLTAGVL